MTDRLDELLEQQDQKEELLWWQDGRVRTAMAQERAVWQIDPGKGSQQETVPQAGGAEKSGSVGAEPVWQEQDRMQTIREVEKIHRAVRRVTSIATGQDRVRQRECGSGQEGSFRAAAVLKNSPAAGWQGLTAQIDTQFRRDARRYDGRLGLL